MSKNNVAGPHEVVIEMLRLLNDFRIDNITKLMNSSEILENQSRSIFIPLPMKPGMNKCKF